MLEKLRLTALVLLGVIGLTLAPRAALAEGRVALVIGNSAYKANLQLANPANDAKLMDAKLRSAGFKTILLVNGDKAAMERAVVQFGEAIRGGGPNTVALFYYAGHGVQIDQRNYLVPVDAALTHRDNARLETVSADMIVDMVSDANADMALFFFDACRNDPYPGAERGLRRTGLGQDIGNRRPRRGMMLAYATAPGAVAQDGRGSNSPYTRALAETIAVQGQKIEDAMKRVREAVSIETSGEQVTWETSSLIGNFYFLQGPVIVVDNGLAPQKAYWDKIRVSNSLADFDRFLELFPDSPYADAARERRRNLAMTQGPAQPGGPLVLASSAGGAQVVSTARGSPFDGQLFAGDLIRTVDDEQASDLANLSAEIQRRIAANGRVSLKVQRRNLSLIVNLPYRR